MTLNVSRTRLILRPTLLQWLLDTGDILCVFKSADDAIKLLPHFPLRITDESKTVNCPMPTATAELIGDETSGLSLRIDRNGQDITFPLATVETTNASIDGAYGMYDDGWLDIHAMFSIHRANGISFDVYIPEIQGGKEKTLNICLNKDEIKSFRIERGKITSIGPIEINGEYCHMMTSTDDKEPSKSASDIRTLGVLLVKMYLDGSEITPHIARYSYLNPHDI